MIRTWKPVAAGIMNIAYGLPIALYSTWFTIDFFIHPTQEDLGIGLFPYAVPIGLIATSSGWLCLIRRWWWLALTTSIIGILSGACSFAFLASLFPLKTFRLTVPVYPILLIIVLIIPTVLIIISRNEFKKHVIVMEEPREL